MERIEKTEVKVIYKSDDGRAFPTEAECLEHEARYKKWWGNNDYHKIVIDEEGYQRHAFLVLGDGEDLKKLLHKTAEYYRGAPEGNGWFYLTCNRDGELEPLSELKTRLEETLQNATEGLAIVKLLEESYEADISGH